jgi:hypothetical protein
MTTTDKLEEVIDNEHRELFDAEVFITSGRDLIAVWPSPPRGWKRAVRHNRSDKRS